MSVTVACPECQSRYQVPESAIGKRVQCKNCSHVFAATVAPERSRSKPSVAAKSNAAKSNAAKSNAAKSKAVGEIGPGSTTGVAIASERWTQFGIDGPLKRPPEIFQPGLAPPPRDILGNHAADPGFLKEEELAARRAENANDDDTETDDELAQIINNPYSKKPKKGKNNGGKSGSATGNKKRKQNNGSSITHYISAGYLGSAAIMAVMGLGFFVYLILAEDGSQVIVPQRMMGLYEKLGAIGVLVGFQVAAVGTIAVGIIAKRFGKKD